MNDDVLKVFTDLAEVVERQMDKMARMLEIIESQSRRIHDLESAVLMMEARRQRESNPRRWFS